MSLQGNLSDLQFEDLMRVFTLQNRTGVLYIVNKTYRAEVFFENSSLHSAFIYLTDKTQKGVVLQGLEAVFEILCWAEGQFQFVVNVTLSTPPNIFTTVDYIILEHCRYNDEKDRNRQRAQFKPYLLLNPPAAAQINLKIEQWRVLLQINGARTVEEIAGILSISSNDLLVILEELQTKGLLGFAQPLTTKH